MVRECSDFECRVRVAVESSAPLSTAFSRRHGAVTSLLDAGYAERPACTRRFKRVRTTQSPIRSGIGCSHGHPTQRHPCRSLSGSPASMQAQSSGRNRGPTDIQVGSGSQRGGGDLQYRSIAMRRRKLVRGARRCGRRHLSQGEVHGHGHRRPRRTARRCGAESLPDRPCRRRPVRQARPRSIVRLKAALSACGLRWLGPLSQASVGLRVRLVSEKSRARMLSSEINWNNEIA
jgi:hypothetical protein